MTNFDLITPGHRQRQAVIDVRQSTPQHALSNTESQRLQYVLPAAGDRLRLAGDGR